VEEELQRRIAINEATLRSVNEAIAKGRWPSGTEAVGVFRCECAQLGCTRLIELTAGEYENVRAHSRRFVVAADHQATGAESVVETHDSYIVVEKFGEGGRVAQATDPRP
jgi:hypothetical protein